MASMVNPFAIYRRKLDLYGRAMSAGMSDADYLTLVAEADARISEVFGHGFAITPLVPLDIDGASRSLVAKVETGGVGGSHKARHLFGLLLEILIDERSNGDRADRLAIASCGNAAVGAAIVARAAQRQLRVFVPPTADAGVLALLDRYEAQVEVCRRSPGAPPGDPCLAALGNAMADGYRPFTVQGNIAPGTIDGGRTLGLELAAQLAEQSLSPTRLFVQVGGGALATAAMDGLMRSPTPFSPSLFPVQPVNAHPYVACWERAWDRLATTFGLTGSISDPERARVLQPLYREHGPQVDAVLGKQPDLMTPWPSEPSSVASGIVDDVTYDWQSVMAHQLRTGGWPITVSEATFRHARDLIADKVNPAPDATGAAGLAGLLTLAASPDGASETWPTGPRDVDVVLLTGTGTG